MMVTRSEQLRLLPENRYSIYVYRYDDDPGRSSMAGAAYDMDAGSGDGDYEGGDTNDDGGDDGS